MNAWDNDYGNNEEKFCGEVFSLMKTWKND